MRGNMEDVRYRERKFLRPGFTTGTCAAMAGKAAVTALLTGCFPDHVSVVTPAGKTVTAVVENVLLGVREDGGKVFRCAVRKDAGDDPDVTDGLLIYCQAEFYCQADSACGEAEAGQILIRGGDGIGRVTKPGLDQPPGEAAINSVPRAMLRAEAAALLEEAGETRTVLLTVSAPGGEEIAKKTFNPVLGIVGGISILGTSGIVEPMSDEALTDTIFAQLKVLRAAGRRCFAAVPGRLGTVCLKERLGEIPEDEIVVCSNFIGKTVDMAAELGFTGMVLCGHLGKLVKLGCGIMNTHSREGDGRMDTLVSCCLEAGAELSFLKKIFHANTTEEAFSFIREEGLSEEVTEILLKRISHYLGHRAPEGFQTGVLLFSQEGGFLGSSAGTDALARRLLLEAEERRKENVHGRNET